MCRGESLYALNLVKAGETAVLEQYYTLPVAEFSHSKLMDHFNTYSLIPELTMNL